MPPAGDWTALGDRLFAGEVCAVFAWFFYKLGSQRVTLGLTATRLVLAGRAGSAPGHCPPALAGDRS
jgi:hypothetical protein